jgi:hypothetical protein
MQKQTTLSFNPAQISENALNASRQVWLASLGAAAVTRDWVQTEAAQTFKTLVKEGTIVESRAVMFVGDQIEGSMTRANTLWKQTRQTVESTVKQAADTAVALAQKALPKSLPKFELPLATKPTIAKSAAKARKAVRAGATRTAKKVKRVAKRASKR